jgi:hypothetical protein
MSLSPLSTNQQSVHLLLGWPIARRRFSFSYVEVRSAFVIGPQTSLYSHPYHSSSSRIFSIQTRKPAASYSIHRRIDANERVEELSKGAVACPGLQDRDDGLKREAHS